MVSSCSVPTAAGSRHGEAGLLWSTQPAVSPETQHQEQLKPELEDKQRGVSLSRSPGLKAKTQSLNFVSSFWHKREVWGVLPFTRVYTLGWGGGGGVMN